MWTAPLQALWRTHVLCTHRFRHDVQTEDIELSRRMMRHGYRIGLCPTARSGELPPDGFGALWRQRLRWAIGWDQVTREELCGRHGGGGRGGGPCRIAGDGAATALSVRRRFGVWYLVGWGRYVGWVSGVTLAIVIPLTAAVKGAAGLADFTPPVLLLRYVAVYGWVAMLAALVLAACWHGEPRRRRALLCLFPAGVLGPAYLLFQIALLVASFRRLYCCGGSVSGWVVTRRAGGARDGDGGDGGGGGGGAGASMDGKSCGGGVRADAELAAVQETPDATLCTHAPVGPQRSTYGRLGDGMGHEKS